jgi:serine/threonine protein kinase
MGEVFKAHDSRLKRDVAIKVLPAELALDPDRCARFEREARAVAALSHPNILAIYDFSVVEGRACAVTELLEGETLRARLGQGPLPMRRAVEIAAQIARGLAAAHDRGIVHRDLKPENVFLLKDGQVKILDFGVAKAAADMQHSDGETVAGTHPGMVMGTVGYMAPEQVRGEAVDGRADLFAFGAVLYEMVSGRRAFQRDTAAETMTAILKEDPPDLSTSRTDLPPVLDAIVRHCLERNPAERFQSARDLMFNLQSVLTGSGSGPVASAKGPTSGRAMSLRERGAWLGVAVSIAGLVTAVAMWRRAPPAGDLRVARFQVLPPEKTSWAAPLGSPDGSNSGSISPDGTMLAFVVADSTGKPLLWIRPIDSFIARPLAGTEGAAFPFWSGDSRSLGFFTQARLKKIAAAGGPAQTLCEVAGTPRGGAWNRNGDILFGTSGTRIRRISSNGGEPVPIVDVTDENAGQTWPYFLPDDRHFLFYSSASRAVFVGSLDSPTSKRVLASDSNAVFAPPAQILFVREGSLLAQGFDATRLELIGDARPIAEGLGWSVAPWNVAAFSVSTTGTVTYRASGGNRSQFTWFDRAGRELSTVGAPGDYLAPALSHDETRIVFTRRDDQPAGDIWMYDIPTQTASRLTFEPDTETYPTWTPDGSAIIYSSVKEGIVEKSVSAGGALKTLLPQPKNSLLVPMHVSSDGQRLVFFGDMGASTGFDVYTLPMTGGTPIPLVQSPLTDAEPALSPDGNWIAYAGTETGRYEVFVQSTQSAGSRSQISTNGGRQPMWRRDGRELYFVTEDRKLYAVEVKVGPTFQAGTPRFLFDIPSVTVAVRNSYVPTADGQRFLVNKQLNTAVSPINVVFNWGAEPRTP